MLAVNPTATRRRCENTIMPAKLPPWYSVALPHADIREGRLDESVFAANIWAVRQYNAPTTYLDTE